MVNQINWEDIYLKMSPKLLGICRRYVKSLTVAEDLMQEVFITAISKANTFTGKGSIEGWICKIAVNTSLQYLREEQKNKKIPINENDHASSDIPDDANQGTLNKDIIKCADFDKNELLEIIDNLPEHHKIVFNLYVFEGYKHKQIGKMLDISLGTSKSHLARARKKIQQLLYKKALEKGEQTDKEKDRSLLFLFMFRPHYIDSLYKDKLSSFEIKPKKQIDIKNLINKHSKGQILKLKTPFTQLIKTILITSTVSVSVALTGYIFYQKNNKQIFPESTTETINQMYKNNILLKSDTLQYNVKKESEKDSVIDKNILPENNDLNVINDTTKQKVPPVIIHKKVIVRDTVYEYK